jgi:putative transposase
MLVSFKGAHFPQAIILMGVRWYVAYPLSHRHVEELMAERGVSVDHATIQRWVVKYSAQLAEAFHRRKRPMGRSWRMDETYIRVKGAWRYLSRAVDKTGQTVDFSAHGVPRYRGRAALSDASDSPSRDPRKDHHRRERGQ